MGLGCRVPGDLLLFGHICIFFLWGGEGGGGRAGRARGAKRRVIGLMRTFNAGRLHMVI